MPSSGPEIFPLPIIWAQCRRFFSNHHHGLAQILLWTEAVVLPLIHYISGVPGCGISGFYSTFCWSGLKLKHQIFQNLCFRYSRRESPKPPAETARLYRTTKYSLGKRLYDPGD